MQQQTRSAADQGVGLARSAASEIDGIGGPMPRAVEAFAQIIYVTWGESAAVVDAVEGINGMTRSASKAARSAGSALGELNQQATKFRGVAERFHI
ncbi:hypothetical protein [Chromobacterium vaccinii]|uniref:hypothetical protein n=1 Tax=Chromobacterium vaccinii TaxID=1108595 RepID=UPI0031DA3E3E